MVIFEKVEINKTLIYNFNEKLYTKEKNLGELLMKSKHIITTLAIAGAVLSVGHIQANAQTLNKGVIGNLGSYTSVHMRSSATADSEIIDNIEGGTRIKIIEQANDWSKVEYDGTIGFVSSYYINKVNSPSNNTITTNYNTNINTYVKLQRKSWGGTNKETYKKYIDPNNAHSKYEFLRVDRYRNINISGLNQVLENQGVLEGQAQIINDAANNYNIDPIYLAAQSILETGNGQSKLAAGVTINEIANVNKPIFQNGHLIGYQMIKLSKPVTVFNLFGIGARNNLSGFNNRALILGTTYAYKEGWTSVPKAIYGAAKFISNIYVNNDNFNQNTPYKLRYVDGNQNIWHEYATTPYYANNIGELIKEYSYLYNSNDKFLYDVPVFNN